MTDAREGSNRPTSTRQDAREVVQRLREAGHIAYFAGGCVRDELLGLKPKDYDVATDASPQQVRKLFASTSAVGVKFGVILVRLGQSQIEVATFRTDGNYEDGRHPSEVSFTTAQEDARRRDFTINGMFFDPIEGKVIDFVGGQQDLGARVLRAIGDPNQRFQEDHLRVLRAIRFASRFDLAIDQPTWDAVLRHSPQLKMISPERIAEELRLICAGPHPDRAWELMLDRPGTSVADVVFRFSGLGERARSSSGLVNSLKEQAAPFGVWLAAMALEWEWLSSKLSQRELLGLESIRRMVRSLRQSLRISNDEADAMRDTLEGLSALLQPRPIPIARTKRFLARPTARWSRTLLEALSCEIGADVVQDIQRELERYSGTDVSPTPLITGDDLIAQGLTPGPNFKRVLNEVYDAQLESRVSSKDQAMELALTLFAAGRDQRS